MKTLQQLAWEIAERTNSTDIFSRFDKFEEEVEEVYAETSVLNEGWQEHTVAELADVGITILSLAQALGCDDLMAVMNAKAETVLAGLE